MRIYLVKLGQFPFLECIVERWHCLSKDKRVSRHHRATACIIKEVELPDEGSYPGCWPFATVYHKIQAPAWSMNAFLGQNSTSHSAERPSPEEPFRSAPQEVHQTWSFETQLCTSDKHRRTVPLCQTVGLDTKR